MDKSKPTYLLKIVQDLIKQGHYLLTKTSERDAHFLGLSKDDVGDVMLKLTPRDFYKSTTEFYAHAIWQDVYKITRKRIKLYIKFKITNDRTILVITSFKQDQETNSDTGR